jgi:outer membrane protein TolC
MPALSARTLRQGRSPTRKTKITTEREFNLFAVAQVKQPISQLYRIGLGIKANKLAVDLEKEDLRAHRIDIANKVRATYYEILRLQSASRASAAAIQAYKELDRLVASYAVEQTVLRSDVLDVKSRLLSEQQRELSIRHGLQAQKEQMNLLLGRDPEIDFSVEPASKAEFAETDLAGARARALEQRPEIRQATLTIQRVQYDYKMKKSEYIPDVATRAEGQIHLIVQCGRRSEWAACAVRCPWFARRDLRNHSACRQLLNGLIVHSKQFL